jgi:hypothetical protein
MCSKNTGEIMTKKAKRIAKKAFKKLPNSTRQFSLADYNNLPKE